jgi:glycosyltransferase involved in cell wall biosynthesis
MPKKLAVVTTHPIQYYAPVFKLLAKQVNLQVFYTWGESSMKKFDPGFGKVIEWDIPLLDGYNYKFVENISKEPSSSHFKGIINPSLISELASFKPDAILIIGYAYHSHLQVLKHFKNKVSLWFRGDSHLLNAQSKLKSIPKWFYLKWIYSHVNKALYVGTNNKAYFKKYGLKEKKLKFAPHAIENQRFKIDKTEEATALRKHLNIQQDDILILFAGKLEPKKNPAFLLNNFLEMIAEQRFANLHLLFVGNGVLESHLKQKAGQHKQIHFLDFQNQTQMPAVYQSCDIFCLPSQGPGETWGLAVNEAMASGKAILVSDKVGCAKDLVQDNVNGLVFKSNDGENLKQKMGQLAAANLQAMGAASRSIISNWTIEAQVEQIKAAFDE